MQLDDLFPIDELFKVHPLMVACITNSLPMFNSLFIRLNNHPIDSDKIMDDKLLQTALNGSAVTVFAEGKDPKRTIVYHRLPFFSPKTNLLLELKREVIETGKSVRREVEIIKYNKIYYVFLNLEPIKDETGQVVGVAGTAVDITRSKKYQGDLLKSEERSRRLIDSNIIGVVIADTVKIYEANEAFLKIIGYSKDDLKKNKIKWKKITPIEWQESDQKAMEELLKSGINTPIEKEFFRKDGSRVPVLVGAAMIEADPLRWVSFVLDIYDQKLMEKRKDDFVSMSSHELKTPVTILKAYSQILQKLSSPNRTETLGYLNKMNAQITRLTKIINDLLDISKIRVGKLVTVNERFSFDQFAEEIVNNFRLTVNTHTIKIIGKTGKEICADRDRIGQVINNLISNAVKYSPGKEKIQIILESETDNVILKVKDFGLGISKANQEKIFQSFYRVFDEKGASFPGLGIGLFIASEIVRLHHGTLLVDSKKGKGSVFTLTLPINRQ